MLRLVRVAQAEQQRPRQHQEGPSGGHARALQPLHRQRQLLQLRGNKAQLNVSSDGSDWRLIEGMGGSKGEVGYPGAATLTASRLTSCCMSARFPLSVEIRRSFTRPTKSGLVLNFITSSSSVEAGVVYKLGLNRTSSLEMFFITVSRRDSTFRLAIRAA